MQVLQCNNDHVFNQMFDNILTINTLNCKKIHIKYDPESQSLDTIWRWFFNEFKYQCDNYNENNFKFVDEANNQIPISCSVDTTKAITKTTKKIKLMLKVNSNISQYAHVEFNPDKFKQTETSVRVYLKNLSGKSITIHLNDIANTTVQELKLCVQDSEGTPPEQQRIIFSGYQLEDTKTLQSYGISLDSVLHLVLRLRGGMFNEVSGRDGAYQPLKENFYDITGYK